MLLVGQTFGQMEMHDGEDLFTFGYTEDYGDDLVVPGPILHMTEGDSVIIDFHNLSAIPHTVHLHGLDVDQANDGVPQTSFSVPQDEHGFYHLTAPFPGTYIYHCHFVSSIHVQSGMYGLVVVHPASGTNLTWEGGYEFDQDLSFMTFEFDSDWHTFDILNQLMDEMVVLPDYNPEYFMINGFSEQQLAENEVGIFSLPGEVNHVRLSNMGYYTNRIMFPENLDVQLIASDGRPIPEPLELDSVWIMPGERYDVLVSSDVPFNDVVVFEYINMDTQLVEDSQEIAVIIDEPTLLDEATEISFRVFPNPASDHVVIDFGAASDGVQNILIHDSTGKLCFEMDVRQHLQTIVVDTGDYVPGHYSINVVGLDGSYSYSKLFTVSR
jgi:hypothetical protein